MYLISYVVTSYVEGIHFLIVKIIKIEHNITPLYFDIYNISEIFDVFQAANSYRGGFLIYL